MKRERKTNQQSNSILKLKIFNNGTDNKQGKDQKKY